MPIYMDRHDVSQDVTAEIVADLHREDLKIQHKFNCKGLTYWFDDNRKTAFCLYEAPNREAIRMMHDQAHGEVPNQIIEVDSAIVESFLGRIEDPEKSQKKALNIINDPAFRIIMVVGFQPFCFREILEKNMNSFNAAFTGHIANTIEEYNGRNVKQSEDHLLTSFVSVTNAVACALKIHQQFENILGIQENPSLKLKIGMHSGVPVDEEKGLFGKTIKAALSYLEMVKGTIIISSEVEDLYKSENQNKSIPTNSVIVLNPSEEKFLKNLVDFTEKEWSKPTITVDDFSKNFGYSKSRLYRKLVRITGKSPNLYLKDYRLNKALKLLNKRSSNISEVAFDSGFNSPAYFSKCFQESFGILPSTYLKSFYSS